MISDLELCKVFYYAAQCRSITAAAQKLFISQPAVSQSIKQLEGQLGCTLFYRTSRGVKLTAEGEVFYERVKRAFEEIELGERKLAEMLDMESGEIRIGASDMTLKFCLLPYLESFHKLYPKIKINVSNAPTPETLAALRGGLIDFGLISTPAGDTSDLVLTEAVQISDVFVAGKRFEHLSGRTLSLSELEKLPIICLEKRTSTRRGIDDFLRENGVSMSPEIELATSELIVEFARRDLGVGYVMSGFADEAIEKGELFELSFKSMPPERSICIAINPKMPLTVAVKKMTDLISGQKIC